jgi:hypothetical protein
MKRAGQIALTPFPNTDLSGSKRRPVLLIRQASSRFDDSLTRVRSWSGWRRLHESRNRAWSLIPFSLTAGAMLSDSLRIAKTITSF